MTARTACALSTKEPSFGADPALEAHVTTLDAGLCSPEQRNKKSYLSRPAIPCGSLPDQERHEDISAAGWSPIAISQAVQRLLSLRKLP